MNSKSKPPKHFDLSDALQHLNKKQYFNELPKDQNDITWEDFQRIIFSALIVYLLIFLSPSWSSIFADFLPQFPDDTPLNNLLSLIYIILAILFFFVISFFVSIWFIPIIGIPFLLIPFIIVNRFDEKYLNRRIVKWMKKIESGFYYHLFLSRLNPQLTVKSSIFDWFIRNHFYVLSFTIGTIASIILMPILDSNTDPNLVIPIFFFFGIIIGWILVISASFNVTNRQAFSEAYLSLLGSKIIFEFEKIELSDNPDDLISYHSILEDYYRFFYWTEKTLLRYLPLKIIDFKSAISNFLVSYYSREDKNNKFVEYKKNPIKTLVNAFRKANFANVIPDLRAFVIENKVQDDIFQVMDDKLIIDTGWGLTRKEIEQRREFLSYFGITNLNHFTNIIFRIAITISIMLTTATQIFGISFIV